MISCGILPDIPTASPVLLPYELLIGLRYTRAKRRNHFISFISIVSMAGIALGVMALIVVLSVMNGFQKELRTRILGVAAHLEISGPADRLADWRARAGAGEAEHGRAGRRPLCQRAGHAGQRRPGARRDHPRRAAGHWKARSPIFPAT